MAYFKLFLSFVLILATLRMTQGVEYTVTNSAPDTPGGARFTNEVGVEYSLQMLSSSTDFIWRIFQQSSDADRKNTAKVSLFIEATEGVAYTINDEVHVNTGYIQGYNGNIKMEFTGILYHEMTHVWQWSGKGQTPGGLIEGISDFVRLKAGYAPAHWVKPGQGDRWDQGYDVTAHFLDYCNSLKNGFVAEINKKMIDGYSENFFVEILGKTVDQLWSDYKTRYNGAV